MSDSVITITVTGRDAAAARVNCLIRGLTSRRPLHAQIATDAVTETGKYLQQLNRHNTATRLGAEPTNFRDRNALSLQPISDDDAAYMLIPRNTGLGRAFHDVLILPGTGKTYVTLSASPRTYGLHVRDFPEGTFDFAIIHTHRGPCPVMIFKDTKEIGYWLRRSVTQKQDRTLLPSDADWRDMARYTSVEYLKHLIENQPS